jgi:hypothetical protein
MGCMKEYISGIYVLAGDQMKFKIYHHVVSHVSKKQDPKPKLMCPIHTQLEQYMQDGTSVAPCTTELSTCKLENIRVL